MNIKDVQMLRNVFDKYRRGSQNTIIGWVVPVALSTYPFPKISFFFVISLPKDARCLYRI